MGEVIETNPKYWLQKRTNRKTGFPIATIAYYGSDDQVACKVVVGIFLKSTEEDPQLHKWYADEGDIRADMNVLQAIVDLLKQNNVERVSMLDRIFGCPHEEGVDYPDSEPCPQCPFWANRDRFGLMTDPS